MNRRRLHHTHDYISVIQNSSFRSLPITHRGRVRCQLNPAPTVADPIITGCDKKRNRKSAQKGRRDIKHRKHPSVNWGANLPDDGPAGDPDGG